MLAYAIVEEDEEGLAQRSYIATDNQAPHNKTGPKMMNIDTKLTIDSDQLADYRRIEIYAEGSQYKLAME